MSCKTYDSGGDGVMSVSKKEPEETAVGGMIWKRKKIYGESESGTVTADGRERVGQ